MGTARCIVLAAAVSTSGPAMAQQKLHFTYLWHLEQPIYWPDRQASGGDRYERAWEAILRRDAGAAHPENNLRDIFGLADRVAAYQFRPRDSVNAIRWTPEGGAQISYSGGLIENVTSLGNAGQLGYGAGWHGPMREARGWTTGGGKSRCDVVLFSFHHALLPLCDASAVRKEIQLYKAAYAGAWGASPGMSRGFFPSEMAFSERLIPVLASEGVAWSIVSAEKVSRACADFPVVLGSGGVNCDPPNRADQVNPAQGSYYRVSISRGCAPAEAYPYALTPRRARYVDPETGSSSSIIVVPSSQSLSWKDGYAPLGLGDFDALQSRNDPSRPMLVVLAHDGDNAWGGGFSYYMEATPNLVSQASGAGYVPTVVEQYLADHPVPAGDVVHVEDGAWVNADGDFGAPQFINWNWPLLSASGQVDIANGWHEDARNWAVITAMQNRVDTAEQILAGQGQPVSIGRVLDPTQAGATGAERAWHYFLGALNSGYMYYGTAVDMEVKPTIACNEAARCADPIIGTGAGDQTRPTVWVPQRFPWNPGSTNFGPQFGYQPQQHGGDFQVWTFAYDVSGIVRCEVKYRVDGDGVNPMGSDENETYAGGPGVGAWQTVAATRRAFPAGNVYNNATINFFEMPQYIAEQFTGTIAGVRDALVDYYVEAEDGRGLVTRSPIQHVYVGSGTGGGGGGPVVAVSPALPVAGQSVTVTYDPTGRPLAGSGQVFMHWGVNNWQTVAAPDPAMTLSGGLWRATVTLPTTAGQFDVVFNNGAGTWDNNGGQDWHFAVTGGQTPWVMDGVRDTGSVLVATNNGLSVWAGLRGTQLYVAASDSGEGNDHFVFVANPPGALQAAPWAKSGQAARWAYFLADENDNGFNGWFTAAGVQTTAGVQSATGANGGVVEGTIDLASAMGGVPASVWVALGPYATANGGALQAALQAPASINGDSTLDAGEYVEVPTCGLTAAGCCAANCDGSVTPPVLNINDFTCFVNRYAAAQSLAAGQQVTDYANCDGSTTPPVLNVNDFSCFLNRYAAGCP